jgi:putative ubiquitin-RnfH superfamily antitoxin RatB of RatAB toxin-antitoxin module|tara:strand:- start:302 stop:478 length:177 start_codon:yes stop_codon:yes gene_type:complete
MTTFEVAIVLALPERQSLRGISVTDGDTVIVLLAKSGLREECRIMISIAQYWVFGGAK